MPSLAGDREGWLRILTDLEAELSIRTPDAAGSNVADQNTTVWVAPRRLGPIPQDLEERARLLLAAQSERRERLEEAQRVTGRHLTALRSVPSGSSPDRSVYLDVLG
ncbi:hypothetical protein [Glaciibacter superstes]|uniref:hypothetical protein n=1 Tax=Glaciibacter superstes TaxID=501023 RepID=UPI0003B2F047|nr:hypothetical protein [Glaciibacter superstes]